MIAVVMAMSLIGWSYWLTFRDRPSPGGTTPVAAPVRPTAGLTTALGLEDDPDQWQATRGGWTALDERQLTRLLADSAPIIGPATNRTDGTVSHPEHEDTT